MSTYLDHASHGPWKGDEGVMRCRCGEVLWVTAERSVLGPRARRKAARALMRAERAVRIGYRPSQQARAAVEGAE